MVGFFYAFVLQTNHLESWPLKKNDWPEPIKMFPTPGSQEKNKKSFKKFWWELKKYYFYTTKQNYIHYVNNNIKPYQTKEIVLG
jgi:hypothetical protein